MPIPESIARTAILKALEQLRKNRDIPPRRESAKYDLIYKGERYPPKYVLSRANKFIAPGNERLRTFRGGRLTNEFLGSNGFKIVPKGAATASPPKGERRFWVVSPNVAFNPSTIDLWKQAIRDNEAAFMGWGPKDDKHPLGPKFAETIAPDDVILIARRSEGNPDVVGLGVVTGKYQTRLKGFTVPALDRETWHGSIRKLSPFASVTALPSGLPIWRTVNHAAALCQLHPDRILEHRKVCDWMSQKLGLSDGKNVRRGAALKPKPATQIVRRKTHRDPAQFDFSQRSAEAVRVARKLEAALVRDYKKCLGDRGHVVEQLLYGRLVCDAHEEDRNNLIEAKSSNGRGYYWHGPPPKPPEGVKVSTGGVPWRFAQSALI